MVLKKFLMAGIVAAVLVACGDDDSSDFATRPSGDSSSACEDCDGSSSSAKSSASVAYVEPCRADSVDTCEYGTLTDERDGQTYKTVKIGTQTWMAENLNYAYTGVSYVYKDRSYTSDSSSWCYDNDAANCAKYGRLYTWAAAMDSVGMWTTNGKGCGDGKTCSPTYPVRGVCPGGWHLPDTAEWKSTLFIAVGGRLTAGKMLRSTSDWNEDENGMDAYGFSALPAGLKNYFGDVFTSEGYSAFFWSSSEYGNFDISSYHMRLNNDNDEAGLMSIYKTYGFSVRCVKDD